ncbi:extracellular solute-binding protein [Phaeovulum sp.]|uniref:extracellular solute-binding protein n=1 Tax=Phaeovulum sp. TaxID=2934796 RepID=UPI0027311BAE|nr:extracellular solute-binding protein [Phaeovulum sp.]MDP1670292.1 extracellular solute-binding protein [Phaeovulum sp.]MDP2063766.1 extracellular solute-binding protein [Phaeovulum sp.]MDP3860110.1 extracellular solute-binding protein [Phaeovulum sp.]MDZ4120144.1 extracellular solute-binding protein [Phaeovulum sp.]
MKKILLATVAILATASFANAGDTLNLYNWGNYTNPDLLAKFAAETGITVTVTDYDSNSSALAKVEAGGSGFDLVVPSANYVPVFVAKGLLQPLDHARLANIGNIAPEWVDVPWDNGRAHTVPWQWGTTGVAVNTSVYSGDPNTSDIFLNPPAELVGKVNVVPEMADVMAMAIMHEGGVPCTEDLTVLKRVRDLLVAAKPKWRSMDYGMTEKMSNNDVPASVNWNGSTMRIRANNPAVVYGYPREGYPVWMDSIGILSDAKNVDEAYKFLDFIMVPENAAMISSFARYANGISGSDAFMPEAMKTAPEIVVPAEFLSAGQFLPTCSASAAALQTAIWTELMK